jgi:hypothetical protein
MSSGTPATDKPPPFEGFFKTTWKQREQWLGWDLALATAGTAAGVLFVHDASLKRVLPGLLTAEFGLIGAVLGVVIAGLAIVVGFLSREYAQVLMRADDGPIGDFWPFWFVAVIAACAVIAAGTGLIVIDQVPCLRRTVFGVTTFLSLYTVLATANLVAFVAQQGVTRAWQLTRQRPDDQ